MDSAWGQKDHKYWWLLHSISPIVTIIVDMNHMKTISVQFSDSVMSNSLQPHDCSTPGFPVLHHLPEFPQTHVHWVGDAIQPSHPLLLPFLPALNFSQHPVSRLFLSGGHCIGTWVSAPVLLMNIQSWFPLGLTGLISLLSKGLSRILSSTTIPKHPFFDSQPSLWSISHIRSWLLEKS